MPRLCVFIDYQNVYMGARKAFHAPTDPGSLGQIDPLKLAEAICAKDAFGHELTGIRIYRGRPVAERDAPGHAANLNQCAAWEKTSPKVSVISRPLSYPSGTKRPLEKGIDVALAVDFVTMAIRNEYDVGVIVSTDNDLKPALEAVMGLRPPGKPYPRAAVASWSAPGYRFRLSVADAPIWCHWLGEDTYLAAADRTRYG